MSLKVRRASLSVFFSFPLFLTTVLAIAEVRLQVEPGFHGQHVDRARELPQPRARDHRDEDEGCDTEGP